MIYASDTEPSNTVPKGSITRQDPVVNTEVDVGTKVTVYISAGPVEGLIEAPKVVGETENRAREILIAANLVPTVQYVKNPNKPDAEVISQSPEEGEYVSEMSEVVIIVNQLTETPTEPNNPTNPTEPTKPDGNEKPPVSNNKTITIDISNKGTRDTFMVKVELQSSVLGTKILHEEVHQRKEGKITVTLPEGSEGSMLKVYIDDKVDSEMVIK